MSLFFDYKVNLRDETPILSAWSNSDFQPILTMATASGKVLMFTEEGEPVEAPPIARPARPTKILWHTYLPTLFVCWDDGVISYWSEGDAAAKEEKSVHSVAICGVCLSPDGSRMVTGDERGVVGVWSTRQGLSPVCHYRREGAMTNISFCAVAAEAGEIPTLDRMNKFFFFAGTSGSVYLADDLKRCIASPFSK